jgi:hypothetical protein
MRSMLPAEVRPQFDDYLATIRRDGVASESGTNLSVVLPLDRS